jgi:glutamyl-tRNA synthetase
MAGTLTVSLKLSPFPFAAVAIAAYTQKADLIFDEEVTTLTLSLNGSKITIEHEVVQALAKAGDIYEDSAKVGAEFY